MTPKQAAMRMQRIASAMPIRSRQALAKSGRSGVIIAHKWSSGPISSLQLQKMGHPYGIRTGTKRRAPVPQPTGLINRQEGLFFTSWITAAASGTSGSLKQAIENTAPYATFLKTGTAKMIARPIIALIKTDLKPIFRANIRAGIVKAINTP